jgi:hypothetical protein
MCTEIVDERVMMAELSAKGCEFTRQSISHTVSDDITRLIKQSLI